MQLLGLIALTCVTLAAAVYTHDRIPYHTSSLRHGVIAHVVVASVAIAFAWVTSQRYVDVLWYWQLLAFLSAFGVVHVPAAAILFIKRQRKS